MSKGNPKEPVTKGMLDDAVKTILEGMDNLFKNFKQKMDRRFDKLEVGQVELDRASTR